VTETTEHSPQPARHAERSNTVTDDVRGLLPARTLRALRSIAEATLWGPLGAPTAARLDWLMLEAEDFLGRAGARTRLLLRLSIFVVSVLAPACLRRFTVLSRLPLRERVRALAHLERSRLGAPLLAVKALLSLLYYEHEDAAREVGFDAHCLTALRVPRA
jgi:hypothetical protein